MREDHVEIALVGPGLIGLRHLALLASADGISVAGVVAPDESDSVPVSFSKNCYRSVRDLLSDKSPDGAIIASPTNVHFEQASEFIRASVPVLIEKPVGRSAAEISRLIDLSEKLGVPVAVGHHRVYGTLFRRLRELLSTEDFGVCHHFISKTIFRKPLSYWEDRIWRTYPENGGIIGINLIHDLDLSQRLFGPIDSVFCDLIDHPNFEALASRGQAMVRFRNGTQGCFIFSDVSPSCASWELTTKENPSFSSHQSESCYEFYFEKGYLKFPEFRFSSGYGLDWLSHFEESQCDVSVDDPLESQIQHFASVVRRQEQPKVSLYDALQNRLVMDAIFQSAASHRWVSVG